MSQDDIEYVLEMLEDAIASQDWDLVAEAQQYLTDFRIGSRSKNSDED